jgi:NodT family efflux transporter outer membrane factor (OMF) lipoprotein
MLLACQSVPKVASVDSVVPRLPHNFENTLPDAPPGSVPATERGPWWERYGSRELNGLINLALRNNSDLKIAAFRIKQAEIRADQAAAGGLPTLTAPFRAIAQSPHASKDPAQSSQAAWQAIWRADVWGEQRGITESAELQVARANHERENIQRVVIGNVVSLYVAYLANNDAMDLARKNEQLAEQLLMTLERRAELGDATAQELEQQRASFGVQQIRLPALENQRSNLRINLARLTGTLPDEVHLSDRGIDSLQAPQVAMALPSSLLLNRPDVKMVEAKMRSANADIAVARARLLPAVDLSMQAGFTGASILNLFNPQNLLVNAVASIAATIFDGGRREGNKALAELYYQEMVETYAQTVYQAVREVEAALSGVRSAHLQLYAQHRSTRSALAQFQIATNAYTLGSVDITVLLEARKNYQRSQDEEQSLKELVLTRYADLAIGLGGKF